MGWRRLWDGVVGPGATAGENVGTACAAVLGGLLGARSTTAAGPGRVAAAAVGLDLLAGAFVNNALPASHHHHHPGTGPGHHVLFAAAHVHPFVLAALDGRGAPGRAWALRNHAYAVLGTAVVTAVPTRLRRPLAALVCCLAAAHDTAADDAPPGRAWAARTLHVKPLLGQALYLEPG